MSLGFYEASKHTWNKEQYTKQCIINEINRIAWTKAGVWKVRGLGGRTRVVALYVQKRTTLHILLKCLEKNIWKRELPGKKCLDMSQKSVYTEVINSTNITQIKKIGQLSANGENEGEENSKLKTTKKNIHGEPGSLGQPLRSEKSRREDHFLWSNPCSLTRRVKFTIMK